MCIYMYMCMYMYVHMYIYIYIYMLETYMYIFEGIRELSEWQWFSGKENSRNKGSPVRRAGH